MSEDIAVFVAEKIGHTSLDTAVDAPWSQYFCCMTVANREFARNYPIAAKRALRAFLKATDICALEPERARYLAESVRHLRSALEVRDPVRHAAAWAARLGPGRDAPC